MSKILSWLLPALLILVTSKALGNELQLTIDKAVDLRLYENPKWISLLHIKNGQSQIKDKKFALSSESFSPKNELEATLRFLFDDLLSAQCRFPARYFFLNHHLDLEPLGLNSAITCPELQKYKEYVPYDQLNLIYASEVLASASSMMGHSFLNAKGVNLNQSQVSHSISFFTEFESFNPAKLIYDGLVSGMKGLFIVRPFEKDLKRYSQTEGRNVWSYGLNISDFDLKLIKLHIWELKDVEIEYLFQSYNCATLTLYILSIANPALVDEDILFVSPLDVIKAVNKHGMIKNVGVELSDDWALKMLEQEIEPNLGAQIESLVFKNKPVSFDTLDPKSKRFAVEYLSQLLKNEVVKSNLTDEQISALTEVATINKDDSLDFDLSHFKNPIKTPQDSVFTSSVVMNSDRTSMDFSFLPASHYLYGDNRQYFSESELRIGEISVRIDTDSNNVKLQSLTLYSFRSLAPSSRIVSKYSGSFYLGYRQILDQNFNENGFFNLSGGMGKSIKAHKDVLLYGNLDVGLAANKSDVYLYAEPNIGAIINLVGDSKVLFEYRLSAGQYDTDKIQQSFSTQYSWFAAQDWTVLLAHKVSKIQSMQSNQFQISVGFHF